MASANTIKKNITQKGEDKIIKFEDTEEILFPKICVICGINTENHYKQTIYGSFVSNKEYKKDYVCDLPVCNECVNKVKMKTGISSKSGQLVLVSCIMGLISAIIFYYLTYSIFISISLFATSIIIPYMNYRKKTRRKIKLKEFLEVTLSEDSETIIFDFLNPILANFIKECNTKKEGAEEDQKETEDFDKFSETNHELLESEKNKE